MSSLNSQHNIVNKVNKHILWCECPCGQIDRWFDEQNRVRSWITESLLYPLAHVFVGCQCLDMALAYHQPRVALARGLFVSTASLAEKRFPDASCTQMLLITVECYP